MEYRIVIKGHSEIICNNIANRLDKTHPWQSEVNAIAKKKGINRTEADESRLKELETLLSVYWTTDGSNVPTLPTSALRVVIEKGARKLKQGPLVREGLMIDRLESFTYDTEACGATMEEVAIKAQFTVPVVVQRARVLRTRAMFSDWQCVFVVWVEKTLVDKEQLETWLTIAGKRVGLCDWRPEKSGEYGRFTVGSIEAL